jgi:hypothetical protein
MDYLSYLGIVALTAGSVGIRVAQQLNVTRGYYVRAFFTSYIFTIFDALVVGTYASLVLNGEYITLLFAGTGSAIGGLFVMFFYHKKG